MLCFVIAYPLAYYLAKVARGNVVPTLFLLLLIPLWVSEILRVLRLVHHPGARRGRSISC